MVAALTATSSLIIAIALLGLVIFLNRIAKPLSAALMMCAMRASGRRLSSLIRAADDGTPVLPTPTELLEAALLPHDEVANTSLRGPP